MTETAEYGEDAIARASEAAEEVKVETSSGGLDAELFHYARNDYGNAQRLLKRFGQRIIHVSGKGWYAWDGKRWNLNRGDQLAQQLAHTTALGILEEIKAYRTKAKDEGKDKERIDEMCDKHRKWATASGNSARIKNMLVEALPYVDKPIEAMDASPYLFNTENYTLELGATVKTRRHRPQDLITRCAPVKYDQKATYPVFRAFLDRIVPEASEQAFLQRYLGSCLTGDISEQKLLLCHGDGRNGKSTLLETVMGVLGLGEYGMQLPFESLLQDDRKSGSQANPDIARLPGARFVTAVEPEQGARISTSMIKRFTGGEAITARDLNKGFFDFEPQFKLCLSFNPKPTVPAQDDGTWRRIMMLEFKESISDEEKDKHLKSKLREERSGILNWMLDGFRMWREDGLKEPDSVLAATAEYRDENDTIGRFINETLEVCVGSTVTAKDIMTAFKRWCMDAGIKPISQRRLGDRMAQLKMKKDMGGENKTVRYLDLAIASPDPLSGGSGPSYGGGYD